MAVLTPQIQFKALRNIREVGNMIKDEWEIYYPSFTRNIIL